MNKNKSLGCDSIKKRKILLGTLIPLGCLVVATAVVVPVVLTQCGGQQKKFNSAQDMKLYVEKHLKLSIKEGVDFSQKESNDVAMVSWINSQLINISSKSLTYIAMYTFCASFITPDIDDISDIICNSPLKINYSNHTINFDVTVKDIRKVGSFQTTYESNIWQNKIIVDKETFDPSGIIVGAYGSSEVIRFLFDSPGVTPYIAMPQTAWPNVQFPSQK